MVPRRVFWSIVLLSLSSVACGDVVVVNTGGTGGTTSSGGAGGATSSGGATAMVGGGGTGATGGATTTGGGGTSTVIGCQSDADCIDDPQGPLCDPVTGQCSSCIPESDPELDCGIGAYCDPGTKQCEAGCTSDADCPSPDGSLTCALDKHQCVGCVSDGSCPNGSICLDDSCVPGCNIEHACAAGDTCCNDKCYNLENDENNCGACFNSCFQVANTVIACLNGICQQTSCQPGFADCNQDHSDGCEHNTLADGDCLCAPGFQEPCYLGAPGTAGVGVCKAGTHTCQLDGLGFSACLGQVMPQTEICANGADEDCNGLVDDEIDFDVDGYTSCQGDCNDTNHWVNPGAMEIWYTLVDDDFNPMTPPLMVPNGNGLDDDCNPLTPDGGEPAACPSVAKVAGVTATDLAAAFDLCQPAVENPPKSERTWGMISATFERTDGSAPDTATLAAMQDQQAAVLAAFGAAGNNGVCDGSGAPVHAPKYGPTLAAFSTGRTRAPGQADYVSPQPGTDLGTPSACPAHFLAAHNGNLPASGGCQGNCPSGSGCYDGIALSLRIRVPTNTDTFSFSYHTFSAEYPERVCTPFNDSFLALATSAVQGLPQDKNIAFDTMFNPLTVNSLFYTSCSPDSCFLCPGGVADLACTGMHGGVGASTGWLVSDVPVIPGETITLRPMVFDVSDGLNDTVVLLDNFHFYEYEGCQICPHHP